MNSRPLISRQQNSTIKESVDVVEELCCDARLNVHVVISLSV